MRVPDWWSALLLAGAAWRTFQLIARDDILDRPRLWALRATGWKPPMRAPAGYRAKWAEFITCPYCAGMWITLAWWGAWQIAGRWTLIVAAPLALAAVLIAIDQQLRSHD